MFGTNFRLIQPKLEGGILTMPIAEPQIEGEEIAELLRAEFLQALAESNSRHAVIDFQNIKYISSIAFRPLLALRRALQAKKGRLVVCGLNPVVGDIFYTTRMIDPSGNAAPMFELQQDISSAIAFLQNLDAPKDLP